MNANSSVGERSVFFVSDSSMLKHKCEWDDEHIEVPQRLEIILTNLKDNILKECETIKPVAATIDDIRLVHDEAYIESLEKTTQMNIQQLESYCSGFEDVYANNFTYDACLMSAGCAIEAMKSVINERHRFSSAFAAVRPPGHHASKNNACGFCFFNNVAICALKARQLGVERVLIVDWDVHAGQGTQYSIKSDPNIKLISIHRFENGHFWPNLPENSIQHDYENTINVTLNKTGLGDSEYVAVMNHFIRPIMLDFNPSLVLVSCGFDAAIGDPEGQMRITPGGYQWITDILIRQAVELNAPVCLLLEGGYFLETLAVNVEFCIKALLGKPLPRIYQSFCDKVFLNSLHTAVAHYGRMFPSLSLFADVVNRIRQLKGLQPVKPIDAEYKGFREFVLPYPTRGTYKNLSKNTIRSVCGEVESIMKSYNEPHQTRELLLQFNSEHSRLNEDFVSIDITDAVDLQIVRNFLNVHLCESSLSFDENIRIVPTELGMSESCCSVRTDLNKDSERQATINCICETLLRVFERGFAKNFEHILLADIYRE